MHEYVYVYEYVYVPKVAFTKKCLKQKTMTITPESVLIIDENNACLKGDNNKYTQKMKKVKKVGKRGTAHPPWLEVPFRATCLLAIVAVLARCVPAGHPCDRKIA